MRQARTVIDGIPQEKQSPTVLDAIYTSPLIGKEDKTLVRPLSRGAGHSGREYGDHRQHPIGLHLSRSIEPSHPDTAEARTPRCCCESF